MALLEWSVAFEATPAGTDAGSVLDDRIKELKEQVRRRFHQAGQCIQIATPNEDRDGRHAVDADGAGTGPDIYKSDFVTKLVTYDDNYIESSEPVFGYVSTAIVPLPLPAVGRVPGIVIHNRGEGYLKLEEVTLGCLGTVAGAGLVVDIHRLTSAWQAHADGYAATANPPDEGTIWNAKPTIAAAAKYGGPFTSFSLTLANPQLLNIGEAWVIEADSINGATDVFMTMKVSRWHI